MLVLRRWLLVGLAVVLANGCSNPAPRAGAKPPAAAPMPPPPRGLRAYAIDAQRSEVRVLVYRAGKLARLGHNHVIVNHALAGWVAVADRVSSGAFYLRMAAAEFSVDDDGPRSQEGADFAAEVPADAKAGTRRNMLSAAVLDAVDFPHVAVKSLAIQDDAAARVATASIEVAGHESTAVIPFTLDRQSARLVATGSVSLRQSSLGLTPLSVGLGALQVQDEIRVKFTVVASGG
jgi:polyisoprenoid-binding protein YceI